MLHDGPPHASNAAYAYAKRLLEIQSSAYHQQYGKQFVCVIPTNIYGPHDNFHLEDAHVIPALIHKCYLAKNKDEDFVVAGTGRPLRQFIYSEDLARLILWTLEHYKEPSSLILSPNEEVSIETVARIIARAFHYEHKMVLDTSRPDGQYKKTADNSKLKRLLPSVAFVPVEDGIKNTVQWFMNHYDSCRK
jgi:GDP-L-fucose synthase